MRWWMRGLLEGAVDGRFEQRALDHTKFYKIHSQNLPGHLKPLALELTCDQETQDFLHDCYHPGWHDTFANATAYMVKKFMSMTDTNALLGRGQMFVLSSNHFSQLLDIQASSLLAPPSDNTRPPKKLLDVGAGDGGVTERIRHFFDQVHATEVSQYMCQRLRTKGFEVIETGSLEPSHLGPGAEEGFDVVTCFNVLDRCHTPLAMLRQMAALARPRNGLVVVAVVLPWCPFVEEGTQQKAPVEQLDIPPGCPCQGVPRMSFEQSANLFESRVLRPCGLDLVRMARVPYLCKGDSYNPFYSLDDVIFVCKTSEQPK